MKDLYDEWISPQATSPSRIIDTPEFSTGSERKKRNLLHNLHNKFLAALKAQFKRVT
jgi:hypothetical protein